jgi:hypothetical protein
MNKTITITSQPFYDEYNQCYKNILTVNNVPFGPLNKLVRRIKFPKLSPFQVAGPCTPIPKCGLALVNRTMNMVHCGCVLMTPDDIPDLIEFLLGNGYQMETQITNMLNQSELKLNNKKLAFTVTYYGTNSPNITYMR